MRVIIWILLLTTVVIVDSVGIVNDQRYELKIKNKEIREVFRTYKMMAKHEGKQVLRDWWGYKKDNTNNYNYYINLKIYCNKP